MRRILLALFVSILFAGVAYGDSHLANGMFSSERLKADAQCYLRVEAGSTQLGDIKGAAEFTGFASAAIDASYNYALTFDDSGISLIFQYAPQSHFNITRSDLLHIVAVQVSKMWINPGYGSYMVSGSVIVDAIFQHFHVNRNFK